MAAAVLFGAVACSQQSVEEIVEPQEVTSVLSVNLEGLNTRLSGDSSMIDKVAWGVYDSASGQFLTPHSSAAEGVGPADFVGGQAEIEVTLFTGKAYDLVFFAYCSANTAYSINWTERELNVDYSKQSANLEANDAFFHIENGFTAGKSETFTLKRPFAQLNVGQNEFDYDNMKDKENAYISKSYVKAEAYTKMSLVTGAVVGEAVPVELALNYVLGVNENSSAIETLTVGGEEYKHIAMNYLLVADKHMVNQVDFEFLGTEGTTFYRSYYNVPLQRNYRTNILGSIISDEAVFTVVIDPAFEKPEENYVYHAFQYGGEVTLADDIEVSHTLVAKANALNKPVVLNLNGKTIKNNVANQLATDVIVVEEGATLIINGEGTVEAVSGNDGYTVIAEGTVIINGGTFKAGVDENGEPNAVVYARGNGKVYVKGGYFPNENNSNYVLNKKDADRATTVIEVKGGKFYNFNPENNAAENAGTNFCAEGYSAIADGDWYEVVRMISVENGTELTSALATTEPNIAFADAITSNYINIPAGREVTLFMNNQLFTSGTAGDYGLIARANSNLTIKDANYTANGGAIGAVDGAKVTFENGSIYLDCASTSARYLFYVVGEGTEATINNGNFSWDPKDNEQRAYVYVGAGSTVTINGGTFGKASSRSGYTAGILGAGTVVIKGGTFGFNPSAWVAEGYVATKNGSTWTVSAE